MRTRQDLVLVLDGLDEHSQALGAWLQSQGLAPGARVAVMLPNIPQFLVTMAAILRAGYKTKSRNLGNQISMALAQLTRAKKVKKVGRGMYRR